MNTTSSRNPSERPTRLLPGALLPAPWLAGGLLQDALPGVRAALARGTLQMQTLTLSPGTDWAHDRWLRQHPALAPLQLPDGAMAAVQALAGAQSAGVAAGRQMHDTALEHGHAGPPAAAEASASHEAPCWLMQPVTFRLTTDAMLVDTRPQALVDEPLARRLGTRRHAAGRHALAGDAAAGCRELATAVHAAGDGRRTARRCADARGPG